MKRWCSSLNAILLTKRSSALVFLWAIVIVLYFNAKAPVSMLADWTHDDLMNCYRAVDTPWQKMLTDVVFFWKPSNLFRPLGELLYKVGFAYSGFNMWPWRLVISGILILNAFLLGHLAMRLSNSLAYSLAVTAVASYHPHWFQLYINSGTVFEILAFTFVFAGLACYVEFHDRKWVLIATALLYVLGLNSKESVIVLPVFLVLYDWLWHKRLDWKLCTIFGAISLAFIFGRVYGPNGLSTIGQYQPTYSLATYLSRFQTYFSTLILWRAAPLWAAVAIAFLPLLLCRNRMAAFACLIFPIGILPLAFVPERGLDGVYVACAGLALGLSCVLLLLPKESWRLAGTVALLAALMIWTPARRDLNGIEREFQMIHRFRETLSTAAPTLPLGTQIRFLREPFRPEFESWASVFITRLLYRDFTIDVVAPNNPTTKDWTADRDYAVFDWRDDKVVRIK